MRMRSTLIIPYMLFLTPGLAHVLPKPIRRPFIDKTTCTAEQVDRLEHVIQEMIDMAKRAVTIAKPGNPIFDAIFGPETDGMKGEHWVKDEMIHDRFFQLANLHSPYPYVKADLPQPTIRCDFFNSDNLQCSQDIDFRTHKYSIKARPETQLKGIGTKKPEIMLCWQFWTHLHNRNYYHVPPFTRQPIDSFIPTAGMLLHDMLHALFALTDIPLPIPLPPKTPNHHHPPKHIIAFGHKNVLMLPRLPNGGILARMNADSYKIFAAMAWLPRQKGFEWSLDPMDLGEGPIITGTKIECKLGKQCGEHPTSVVDKGGFGFSDGKIPAGLWNGTDKIFATHDKGPLVPPAPRPGGKPRYLVWEEPGS